MRTTGSPHWLVAFDLDDWRCALHLAAVERVIHAVEITGLPEAPDVVAGAINVQGRIIPVVKLRKRFGLPARELAPGDQMIITKTSVRPVALVVDAVTGVTEYPAEALVPADTVLPGMHYVEGVAKLDGGMVLILDLDRFLSLEEGQSLDRAMAQQN